MARMGRDLERVISLLEGSLPQSGIQLKSPDFLPDKDTGALREVDISLRGRIGSSDILAIIECRDRDATADVTWIEQVITKRNSVNADKAMAVSSSKFSKPATLKAKKYNIVIRTLDEIDPADITELFFKRPYMLIYTLQSKILHIHMPHQQSPEGKEIDIVDPIFKRKIDNKLVSFNDIWINILNDISSNIQKEIPLNGTKIQCKIIYNFPNVQYSFQASTKSGDLNIESLIIYAFLWFTEQKVPSTSLKEYRDKYKDIAKIQEFRFIVTCKT
jgi:hypothetical protein